jgi:penicillin-binding protein 1A
MAHAYETFATGGRKVFNPTLGSGDEGPIGIHSITCPVCAHSGIPVHMVNHPDYRRIMPAPVASTVEQLLTGVVNFGTGTKAAIPGVLVAGKTGTTSNYGDAWFVGWTPQMTVAVWVGYPNKLVSMSTQYNGQPVEGGTFPAIIWHAFMTQALQILAQENPSSHTPVPVTTTPVAPITTTPATPVTPAPVAPAPTTHSTPTPKAPAPAAATQPPAPAPGTGPGTGKTPTPNPPSAPGKHKGGKPPGKP